MPPLSCLIAEVTDLKSELEKIDLDIQQLTLLIAHSVEKRASFEEVRNLNRQIALLLDVKVSILVKLERKIDHLNSARAMLEPGWRAPSN